MSLKAEQHILSFEVVHCDVQLIDVDVFHLQVTDVNYGTVFVDCQYNIISESPT